MSDETSSPDRQTLLRERAEFLSETLADHLSLKACRYGYMLYFNTDLYVGDSVGKYGEWAEVESQLFAKLIEPGMTVVEAGANIGTHTLALAKMAGPTGRVYAFEPQRRIFQLLCASVALNDLDNIFSHQTGLSDENTTMFLAPADYTRKENFAGLALEGTGVEEVEVRTLDSYCLAKLDFLKIDVEAMEARVLAGAAETIAKFRPSIFIENDRVDGSSAVLEALFEADYRCWWHISNPYNDYNFFGNDRDAWNGLGESNNMICFPRERCTAGVLDIVGDWKEALDASETWKTALEGRTRIKATRSG